MIIKNFIFKHYVVGIREDFVLYTISLEKAIGY